jgi:hypothetical protein
MVTRICGEKAVKQGRKKLRKDELHNFHCSSDITGMKWAAVRMGIMRKMYIVLV